MSGTGKRGADKLNIIGVVVVGLCGAILTYVSIVALEAYYMNETTAVERTLAHEAPNSLRNRIADLQKINLDGTKEGTLSIEEAKKLVVADAQRDPSVMIPGKPSVKPTVEAQYGRPPTLATATPPPAPAPEPATEPATPPTGGSIPTPTDGTTLPATGGASPPPASSTGQPATGEPTPAKEPAAPSQPLEKPATPTGGGTTPVEGARDKPGSDAPK